MAIRIATDAHDGFVALRGAAFRQTMRSSSHIFVWIDYITRRWECRSTIDTLNFDSIPFGSLLC